MFPSIVRRMGIPTLLAGAFLVFVACNRAVEPASTDGLVVSGAPDGIGSSGANGESRSSTNDLLLGSWRAADADGKKNADSVVLTFAAAGTYALKETPPAKVSGLFRDEKGSYAVDDQKLTFSPTSFRTSYDGKTWTDGNDLYTYSYDFAVDASRLVLSIGDYKVYYVR